MAPGRPRVQRAGDGRTVPWQWRGGPGLPVAVTSRPMQAGDAFGSVLRDGPAGPDCRTGEREMPYIKVELFDTRIEDDEVRRGSSVRSLTACAR